MPDSSENVALMHGIIKKLEKKISELEMALQEKSAREIPDTSKCSQQQMKLLGDFLEANRAVKLLIDYESGQIVFANSAACEFYQFRFDEMVGLKIWEINTLGESATRAKMAMVKDGSQTDFMFEHRLASGSIKHVLVASGILNNDGRCLLYSIVLDVSALKEIEFEKDRLLRAVEHAGEALVITNHEGIIQYVNPAFEEITGYARAEVTGKKPSILKSGVQDDFFYQEMWQTISAGRVWHGKMVNKRKDGTFFTEEATISPALDATGKIVNYVGVKRDMTRELLMEEQYRHAQKMESIGRLAGGVAHDFNNMLGVIICHAEMAQECSPTQPAIKENLREILKAAHRSAGLTRQLLAFARKQEVTPQVLLLNQCVEGMMKLLKRLIGEDIKLSWEPCSGLWPIKIDPAQVDQILANLLVNARDAIEGEGRVVISTKNVQFDQAYCKANPGVLCGDFVMLSVADNGCGISREVYDHLFEPFYTTKEEGKGTGLGLATVYGIVRQNNGFIRVVSEPGGGSVFFVYLPRLDKKESMTGQVAENDPVCGNETILFVEDEESMLQIGKTVLERYGYLVLAASSPEQALLLVAMHPGPIHLLITDVVMPGMNGKELHEHIQALYPDIRTLFISGYTANIIEQHGVDCSWQLLRKPFSVKELANRVQSILRPEENP